MPRDTPFLEWTENNMNQIKRSTGALVAIVATTYLLAGMVVPVHAQGRQTYDVRTEKERFITPHWVLDSRYHHDRYYPTRGYNVLALPRGYLDIIFRNNHYFFNSGVWFRRSGPGFVVVTPPFGLVIPVLPAGFVSLTFGGVPYYYANSVYYTPGPGGYVVVAPPVGAVPVPVPVGAVPAGPQPLPVPFNPDLIVYPRNGQSEAQTNADRSDCSQWAAGQVGGQDTNVFQRAVTACLEGRGYTVR
jgi:hypothetical protein